MGLSSYSRLKGLFLGLAIGDALGAPVEFMRPGDFEPLKGYRTGGAHRVSLGEWTDDMAMALALSDALIKEQGKLVPQRVLENFLLWYEEGKFSSRGSCFDIGMTCRRALNAFKRNPKMEIAPTVNEEESGNGSIMRLAPVFVVHSNDLPKLTEAALASSRTTHASPLVDDIVRKMSRLIFDICQGKTKKDLIGDFNLLNTSAPTGFVIDTYNVALREFFSTSSFEEGLFKVVNQGLDSDTVGAVYGQIAGAYYGLEAIPSELVQGLQQLDILEDIFDQLFQLTLKPND